MHALSAARLQAPPAAPQAAARLHAASVASAARRADRSAAPPSAAAAQRGPVSAVRPTPIKLITVSKGGSAALESAVAEYTTRLRRYVSLEEVVVKPNPRGAAADDAAAQMTAEGERVVRSVGPRDRLVLLCERGREVNSEDVARLLSDAGEANPRALVFAIGGPFGHGAAVRERANDSIRLSAMVLNHQVARLVLAEALYRGWTILRGEPYHHA